MRDVSLLQIFHRRGLAITALVIALVGLSLGLIYQQIEIDTLKSLQAPLSPQPTAKESPNVSPTIAPTMFTAQPSPSPSPAPTPSSLSSPTIPSQPYPTIVQNSYVSITYAESSRTTIGSDTEIVLSATATCDSDNVVTVDYSQFFIIILTTRGGVAPPAMLMTTGEAKPLESGHLAVGGNSREVKFQMTFKFPTLQNNFDGPHPFTSYELLCKNSSVIIQSAHQ